MSRRVFIVILVVICVTGLLSGCGRLFEWSKKPSMDEWNGEIYYDKKIYTYTNERFQQRMEKLKNPKSYKSLWIRVSDGEEFIDLESLATFKNLEVLNLWASGKDLTPLASLSKLEYLNLCPGFKPEGGLVPYLTEEYDVDLTPLASLTELKHLRLSFGGPIGTSDITPLASLVELETLSLDLDSLPIGDMAPLASLTKLEKLSLVLSNYSESGIMSLTSLTNLKTLLLEFRVKNVTNKEQAIDQENDLKNALEKALPNCDILVNFRYPGDD